LETAEKRLSQAGIETRRYFKPSLDLLPYTDKAYLPIAHSLTNRVLCLPLFFDLSEEEISKICGILKDGLSKQNPGAKSGEVPGVYG